MSCFKNNVPNESLVVFGKTKLYLVISTLFLVIKTLYKKTEKLVEIYFLVGLSEYDELLVQCFLALKNHVVISRWTQKLYLRDLLHKLVTTRDKFVNIINNVVIPGSNFIFTQRKWQH